MAAQPTSTAPPAPPAPSADPLQTHKATASNWLREITRQLREEGRHVGDLADTYQLRILDSPSLVVVLLNLRQGLRACAQVENMLPALLMNEIHAALDSENYDFDIGRALVWHHITAAQQLLALYAYPELYRDPDATPWLACDNLEFLQSFWCERPSAVASFRTHRMHRMLKFRTTSELADLVRLGHKVRAAALAASAKAASDRERLLQLVAAPPCPDLSPLERYQKAQEMISLAYAGDKDVAPAYADAIQRNIDQVAAHLRSLGADVPQPPEGTECPPEDAATVREMLTREDGATMNSQAESGVFARLGIDTQDFYQTWMVLDPIRTVF